MCQGLTNQATPLVDFLYIADVETLDQPAPHLEGVNHESISQELAVEVAHNLMNSPSIPFAQTTSGCMAARTLSISRPLKSDQRQLDFPAGDN